MFVDLDEVIMLHNRHEDLTSPGRRGLRLSHASNVATFRSEVSKRLNSSRLLLKRDHLLYLLRHPVRNRRAILRKLECFDHSFGLVLSESESCVSAGTKGIHACSPAFSAAGAAVKYWKKLLRQAQSSSSFPTDFLVPSQVSTPDPNHFQQFLKARLIDAWVQLKRVEANSKSIRRESLVRQAETAIANGDLPKSTSIDQILKHEAMTSVYRKLGRTIKDDTFSALSEVIVPDESNDDPISYRSITDRDEMFAAVIQRQIKHFSQANSTPLASGPIAIRAPPLSYSHAHESIFKGTFPLSDAVPFEEVNMFVRGLTKPSTSVQEIPDQVTLDEITAGFKKLREKTSSSPSGRHHGLYKALARNETVMGLITFFINTSIRMSYCPRRWARALQVMIPKQSGDNRLHRLRTIQLLEADLNFTFRFFWGRKLIHNAIDHNLLHGFQFGNYPGRTANSCALLKVLSRDLMHLRRDQGCIFNCDLTACYDRQIPSVSQLSCRRLGLPRSLAVFMCRVLRRMIYRVRTAHGVSSDSFSHSVLEWILGTLQGSGASPACWIAVFSAVASVYIAQFPGDFGGDPQGSISLIKPMDSFVDDTDLWHIQANRNQPSAIQTMQLMAQTWERLLFASGHSLNHTKCFWHSFSWTWADGIPRLATLADSPGEIQLTSGSEGTPITIQRLEVNKATKCLGVWIAPDCSNDDQFNALLRTATNIAGKIRSISLPRYQATMLLRTYIRPKIGYPLTCSTMSKKQCNKIDAQFMPRLKQLMGYRSTIPLPIWHGPSIYGGAAQTSTWMSQGIQKIEFLVGHLRLGDIVTRFLSASMSSLYLLVGQQPALMTYPIATLKSLVNPNWWLSRTWEYLVDECSVHLHCPTILLLHPQRERDSALMEHAIRRFGGIALLRINAVRLYLQVFFLSDLVTSDGQFIDRSFWHDSPLHPRLRTSTLQWPFQETPSPVCWKAWQLFLRHSFVVSSSNLRLSTLPLGRWLPVACRTQSWNYNIDPTNRSVFRFDVTSNSWFRLVPRHRSRHLLLLPGVPITSPPPGYPATVPLSVRLHQYPIPVVESLLYSPHLPTPQIPVYHSPTFLQSLRLLPTHIRLVIGHLVSVPSPESLYAWLCSAFLHIASDGSIRKSYGRGSYSWLLAFGPDGRVHVSGHSLSNSTGLSTLRAEALGHLAALYMLRLLIRFLNIPSYAVDTEAIFAYIDNLGVIQRLAPKHLRSLKTVLLNDYDVFEEIRSVLSDLGVSIDRRHVKSHAFDQVDIDPADIPLPNRLNRQCDTLAEAAYSCPDCTEHASSSPDPEFPSTQASLLIRRVRSSSSPRSTIIQHAKASSLRAYIIHREHWTEDDFDSIAWPFIASATKRSKNDKRPLIKLQHRLWGTYGFRHKRGEPSLSPLCPRCLSANESFFHVFQCQHPQALQCRADHWKLVSAILQRYKVSSYMMRALEAGISSWQSQTPPIWPHPEPSSSDHHAVHVFNAFHQQDHVGWHQALRGRICSDWFFAHDSNLLTMQSLQLIQTDQLVSASLGPSLVTALWQYSNAIWLDRNESVYGKDHAASAQRRSDAVADEVRLAYSNKLDLSESDRPVVFNLALGDRLSCRPDQLDEWLALYAQCRSNSHPSAPGTTPPDTSDPNSTPDLPSAPALRSFLLRFSGHPGRRPSVRYRPPS